MTDPKTLKGESVNEQIRARGEACVMNTYGRFPVAMVSGKASRLTDADGRSYVDFLAGIAVTLFGHGDEDLSRVICEQSKKLLHCSNYYWIGPQVELAEKLTSLSPMDKVFFSNSGAEANEGAIKLARKYSEDVYKKGEARSKILTLEKSFHGRTLGTLAATGQDHFHTSFLPLTQGFDYVPMNNEKALEAMMDESVCAVLFEPVQGEGGVYPMTASFAQKMAKIAKEKDILLIADEVQSGLGRTGQLFAFERLAIEPDIMTLAKGLGGGVPIGAFLAKDRVAEHLSPGDHGSTFGGNPLATAAACQVVDRLAEPGFLEGVQVTAAYFRSGLEEIASFDPFVRQVRGQGLMLALEVGRPAKPVLQALFKAGLLCSTAGPTALRFLPALNISKAEIDEGMDILKSVLADLPPLDKTEEEEEEAE